MKTRTLASAFAAAVVLLIPAERAFAAQENGGLPGEFIETGSGARALSMGKAVAASPQGAESLYWNPAGLGLPFRTKAAASYVRLFEGGNLSELSFAQSLAAPIGFGASILRFSLPGITQRDSSNNPLGDTTDSRTAFLLGAGFEPWENLAAGVAAKYLNQSLAGQSASALDADAGIAARISRWRAGLQLQNLMGAKLTRDGGEDKLPRTVRFGAGVEILPQILVETDFVKPQDGSSEVHAGAEFLPLPWAAFRAGYDGDSPTFGFGLSLMRAAFDYALANNGALGVSHRFTLSYNFGTDKEAAQRRGQWRTDHARRAEEASKQAALEAEQLKKRAEEDRRAAAVADYVAKAQSAFQAKVYDKTAQYAQLALQMDPVNAPAKRLLQEIRIVANSSIQAQVAVSTEAQGAAPELLQFPTTKNSNPDAVAVVIGVRDYRNPFVPTVDYAVEDAKLVREYLVRALGYRTVNVRYLENPTKSEFEQYFGKEGDYKGKLYEMVKDKEADAFVYYAGHGAPDLESKAAYFVPSDADPNLVRLSGYPLSLFYANLAQLPSQNITVVMDTCFSGAYHKGMLLSGASPLVVKAQAVSADPRIRLFSSSGADEVSSWYPEKGHALFTYYFLRALQGEADRNKDGKLTKGEMDAYLKDYVPQEARRLWDRPQHPVFSGADDSVMVKY